MTSLEGEVAATWAELERLTGLLGPCLIRQREAWLRARHVVNNRSPGSEELFLIMKQSWLLEAVLN